MGTEVAISFSTLRTQLENEKSSLCKIDESIKKIVQAPGRYTNDRFNNTSGDYGRNAPRAGGRNSFQDAANNFKEDDQFGKRKQETKTVFSRLSARMHDSDGEGDESSGVKKPRVSSTVWRELPTRDDVVRAQGTDEQSRVRNRRMFGSLLGTLQKFKQEEIMLQTKEEKKAQVERKIEEQARLEKEREQRERKSLFVEREQKKTKIKALEAKMSRVSEFEKWETTQKYLENFILTKAKPHIYWLPKKINDKAAEKLDSSKKHHEKVLIKKQQELQDELQRIEHRCFRIRVPAAKENNPQTTQVSTEEQTKERKTSETKSEGSPRKRRESDKIDVEDSNKSKRDKFAMDADEIGGESDGDEHHDEEKKVNQPEEKTSDQEDKEERQVESEPVESAPVEVEPVESAPVEVEPVESAPVEVEPVESDQVEANDETIMETTQEPSAISMDTSDVNVTQEEDTKDTDAS